jgi:hypothetical protein
MFKKFSAKFFFCLASLLFISFLTGCEFGWHTVFFDNFNRANGELGSKWEVITEANASLQILDKQALYSTTAAENNTIICYHDEAIESSTFRISTKITTDSNTADLECIGFSFESETNTGKSYSLTFNKTWFAIGTTDQATDETTWLSTLPVNLSDNTAYSLELNVDGKIITGCIKDAGGTVLHELKADCEASETWSSFFLLMSNGGNTALKFDDYRIEAFDAPETCK